LITRDDREGRGPLQGLLGGLSALGPFADAAYATGCDVPLLVPSFVAEMIGRLEDADIAVPVEDQFPHPLAAVYRLSVFPQIRELLATDQLRPAFLFERVNTRRVPANELRRFDPNLTTLRNLNRPEDYLAALAEAGLAPDPAVLATFESLRTG
jgi:molybdenum cofactor guanylyltransferase